jgi:hypothetical protein
MTQVASLQQKRTALEVFGVLLCGMGLCFAVGIVGVSYSQEEVVKEKHQLLTQIHEMKSALAVAKVPEEQIPGLLRVHKAALVSEATHEHFIILSFFVLLSLLVSSVGLIVMLWAKLQAIVQSNKSL